jgi:ribosomal protein L30E
MNHSIHRTALVIALSVLCVGAHSQSERSREQVRAELAQAMRTGDIVSGESGLTLREQFPGRYPQRAQATGFTRAQVEAELAAAIRDGHVITGGEIGQRPDQGVPGGFPRELAVRQKSRADVEAELAEAIRTGDILAGGESGQLLNQQNPTAYSGLPGPRMAGATKSMGANSGR